MAGSSWTLEVIDVASPCPAAWSDMRGDDHVRRCDDCRMKVYNISGMSRLEAEDLIQHAEGRLCVRFFRRADGTLLTADCPVGLRAIRYRLARLVAGVAAMAAALLCGSWTINHSSAAQPRDDEEAVRGPLAQLVDWLDPPLQCMMGFAINRPQMPVGADDVHSTANDALSGQGGSAS